MEAQKKQAGRKNEHDARIRQTLVEPYPGSHSNRRRENSQNRSGKSLGNSLAAHESVIGSPLDSDYSVHAQPAIVYVCVKRLGTV